ncbi:MAG TPA: carboxypeptidase-like regulatory domain-containing protein [Dongiaceae bacterium]|nr:carboxypeptidase-like regulatory domain-containing protein [Dongiaceae bacterium]
MNSSLPATIVLAALLVVWVAPVGAARRPSLTIRGVARLSAGDPVVKARVTAMAGRRISTTTDDAGRFTLELRLPDTADLARDSTTAQIWVAARNLHFSAPDGQLSLGLTLKLERVPGGVSRVIATSNDERLAERAAQAVVSGTAMTLDSVRFTGDLGEPANDPFQPQCPLRVELPVTAGAAASSGASRADASPAAGTPQAAGAAGATAGVAGTTAGAGAATAKPASGVTAAGHAGVTAPGPHAPDSGVTAPDTSHCVCRIAGTIETTGGPLREPLRLIVALEGYGTPADTVTLDMGSPRAFDLRGVPCGARRLVVRPASGRMRFNVLDPDHTLPITCQRDGRAQPRVVLVPR